MLGGVFGGGVAVVMALDLVHFGPGMHQGHQAYRGHLGGQGFGGQRPGFGQNGNGNNGGTGQGNGGEDGQQPGPRTGYTG